MSEQHLKYFILINYTLFAQLTDTAIIRNDSVVALNPKNRDHQQGNMCFNIQLNEHDNVETFVNEVNALFKQVGCKPRYHIDCYASPSIDVLHDQFKSLGFHVERDADIVMSCDYNSLFSKTQMAQSSTRPRRASLADLQGLVRVFHLANGYPGTDDWLYKKLTKQICDPTGCFPMFVMEEDKQIVSCVILFTPKGLPHLGHVSGVATLPGYQKKGLAASCLQQALLEICKPDQTFYLDSYADVVHAHRMYERVGFQSHGLMETVTATLED